MTLTDVSTTWAEVIITLKMTSAQVVEMSVNVISNSPCQDYTHPDDRTLLNCDMTPSASIDTSFVTEGTTDVK